MRQVGDAFVVCDAGGGTVVSSFESHSVEPKTDAEQDLISYKITGLDPLRMEECAVGDGMLTKRF